MARCPSCQESLPFPIALKNVLRTRRDPRAQVFTCAACRKDLTMSLGYQALSVVFVVVVGTTAFVSMLMCPWVARQPWFSPAAVGALVVFGFFISYYLCWKFVVRLRMHETHNDTGSCP